MREAVALAESGLSIRKAAEMRNVHFVTLSRYVKKKQANSEQNGAEVMYRPNYNVRQVFNSDQEAKLTDYLINCARMYYGLPVIECRKLALEMAVINKIPHPQSWDHHKMAGIDWFVGFLKRNPVLSQRTPEGCSLSRATSFTKHNVDAFFNNLEVAYKMHPDFANGTRVYNLDETGTSTVQKSQKILAKKEKASR